MKFQKKKRQQRKEHQEEEERQIECNQKADKKNTRPMHFSRFHVQPLRERETGKEIMQRVLCYEMAIESQYERL